MKHTIYFLFIIGFILQACSPQQKEALNSMGFQNIANSVLGTSSAGSYVDAGNVIEAGGKISRASKGFTEEEEYYLGRSVSASILSHYSLLRLRSPAEYVSKVGKTLATHSDRPDLFNGYRFAILNTDEVNAMSTPGGFIFVTKGILKLMPNEDALAAVLAHEIAHVVKGHGVKAISSSNMRGALLLLGQEAVSSQGGYQVQELANVFGSSVADVTDTLLENGYSRSQEYDADAYAAELLRRAGYNDGALLAMLESVGHASNKNGGWFNTHPSPEKRIREAKSEIKDLSPEIQKAEKTRTARFKSAIKPVV